MKGISHIIRKSRAVTHWLRRYRNTKGYGIHSPFAFSFIRKVLVDRKAYYYAFPEIDALCGKTRRDTLLDNMLFSCNDYEKQEARMFFRMLCHFNPGQVIEVGGGNEVCRFIIERSVPHAALHRWSRENPTPIDPDKSCLIVVNYSIAINFTILRSYLVRALDHPGGIVIFVRNMQIPLVRKLWDQLSCVAPRGMSFHDDIDGVLVADPKLPRLDFEILW